MTRKDGEKWTLGTNTYSEEEMQNLFRGVMKGKILFLTPFFSGWNEKFSIRLSDSAQYENGCLRVLTRSITEVRAANADVLGSSGIWPLVGTDKDDFEVTIHSTKVRQIFEDLKKLFSH